MKRIEKLILVDCWFGFGTRRETRGLEDTLHFLLPELKCYGDTFHGFKILLLRREAEDIPMPLYSSVLHRSCRKSSLSWYKESIDKKRKEDGAGDVGTVARLSAFMW